MLCSFGAEVVVPKTAKPTKHKTFAATNTPIYPFCSLDGHPLEIMKLRGTEPVDSIDLSLKGLTVLSGVVIASLISSNLATKSLKYAAGHT